MNLEKEIQKLKNELNEEIIKDLRHKEELFYNLIYNLQVYFNDDERLINYLKKCGFNEEDIKENIIFSDYNLETYIEDIEESEVIEK